MLVLSETDFISLLPEVENTVKVLTNGEFVGTCLIDIKIKRP